MPTTPSWSKLIAQERKAKSGHLKLSDSWDDNKNKSIGASIPEAVFTLSHLTFLDFSNNGALEIPETISELKNLESLFISRNQLTALPESLSSLKKLRSVYLGNNNFSEIPAILSKMPQLEHLGLSDFKLTALPDWLSTFGRLQNLDLQSNRFKSVPEMIFSFEHLEYLNLGDNPLSELDARISALRQLKNLTLYRTGLSTLPSSLRRLSKLESLLLWNNKFTEIPDVIFELSALNELSFSNTSTSSPTRDNNNIKIIPRKIIELRNLATLDVRENPIESPPPEIVTQGIDAIRQYFIQLDRTGRDYLYEAKLLLVGEGGAGKSTLAHKIVDPNFILSDSLASTQGIEISSWQFQGHFQSKSQGVRVNIWDFGGQEIYHATHQFFLTKRSLYIVVADNRKEDTDFYFWLNIIELLSDGSPAIIVKNEKQDRHREIDERHLRARFKNLIAIVSTNLATNRGLADLISTIQFQIGKLPHLGTPLPRPWVKVRRALESNPENYIPVEEYLRICDDVGFSDTTEKLHLSEYLHDLGVCLHFQHDPLLKKILILKPKWGTDAVYRVLDNKKVIADYGHFSRSTLSEIWSEGAYSNMRDELLQLMLNFKLCYAIPETKDAYIAPQLLSPSRPEYEWDANENLIIKYAYEFMPKGIVTQLIVAMHRLILEGNCVWKGGVVLSRDNDAIAEVIEYPGSREIRVRVSGPHRKDLLTIVAYELEKIHSHFSLLKYNKLIPCNCSKCANSASSHFYSFDVLQKFVSDGQRTIQCQLSYEMVDVARLVDDVRSFAEPAERTTDQASGFIFNAPVDTVVIGRAQETKARGSKMRERRQNAWINGSFYLFVFVIVIGTLGFSAKVISGYALAFTVLAGIVVLPLIGALQLRQDDRLSEKSFIDLVKLALAQLPLLSRISKSKHQNSNRDKG